MSSYDPVTVDPDLVAMMAAVFADRRGPRDSPGLDRELWGTLESLGLTRLTAAEPAGGSGATWRESAALLRAAAGNAVAAPLAEHDLLAGRLLAGAGLPIDGRLRTACVLDAAGTARAVPWARAADRVAVLWSAAGQWLLADVPRTDLRVTEGANLAGEPRDDVAIDLSRLDGVPAGENVAEELFLRGALARGIQVCGALEEILRLCVAHATARTQFGRPLARFQAVQHLVADIAAETSLARAAVDAAVAEAAADDRHRDALVFAVAAARSCAGHAASAVVRNAHQVHGAIGTTREHELPAYTRPALAWRSEYGTVHHWDDLLTRIAIEAGPDACWDLVSR